MCWRCFYVNDKKKLLTWGGDAVDSSQCQQAEELHYSKLDALT